MVILKWLQLLNMFPCFGVFFFLIAGPQRWKSYDSICYHQGKTTLDFYFFAFVWLQVFATRCFSSVFSFSCARAFILISLACLHFSYLMMISIFSIDVFLVEKHNIRESRKRVNIEYRLFKLLSTNGSKS